MFVDHLSSTIADVFLYLIIFKNKDFLFVRIQSVFLISMRFRNSFRVFNRIFFKLFMCIMCIWLFLGVLNRLRVINFQMLTFFFTISINYLANLNNFLLFLIFNNNFLYYYNECDQEILFFDLTNVKFCFISSPVVLMWNNFGLSFSYYEFRFYFPI